ncbi:hypothetical protein B0H16DRAFT_1370321 [Mycena metata]|uniref:Uncharacterized protein n=1 Tax=Mycena metata TaxID=1033252 RepID=A0AAD7NGI4_9AGAR|nr:hypothetical protein B0H16DRAFT_1370321 [Mycena metata]
MLNTPFGMCTVSSMGAFDATKGGYMVFWELKLVIEFPLPPPFFFPRPRSPTFTSPSSTAISAPFTQYIAGGLMRRAAPRGYRRDTRWQMGLDLLSTVDELFELEVVHHKGDRRLYNPYYSIQRTSFTANPDVLLFSRRTLRQVSTQRLK